MRKIIEKLTVKKKILFALFTVISSFLFYGGFKVLAVSDDEIARIIYENKEFFVQNGIFQDGFRWVGWKIVGGLRWMANSAQELYRHSLGLADFTSYEGLTDWISTIEVVCVAIMAVSIMWFGINLVVNHKKVNNIVHAIMIAGLCICALTEIMIRTNGAVRCFCRELQTRSMADSVINNNLYDLIYIDDCVGLENISSDAESLVEYHYGVFGFDFDSIDINEVINYDSSYISSEASDILSEQVTYFYAYKPGEALGYEMTDVYNGWGWNSGDDDDWFNEFYYRYHTTGFPIVVSLLSIIIVYLCVSYRTARIFWELPLKRILALFYAHDVTGTQKTLKILGSIKDSYIILMVCGISLKMFSIYETFLSEKYPDNPFVYCMLLIFGAFAVIDGPTLVQALTGEDAGLQTAFQRVVSVYQGGKGKAKGAFHMAGGAISYGVGRRRHRKMMEAMKGGKEDNKQAKSNIPNGVSGSDSNKDVMNGMKGNGNESNQEMKEGMKGKNGAEKENGSSKNNLNGNSEQDNLNQDIKDSELGHNMNSDSENNQSEGSMENSNLDSSRESNEEERKANPEDSNRKNNPLETHDPSSNGKVVKSSNEDMKKAMASKNKKKNGNLSNTSKPKEMPNSGTKMNTDNGSNKKDNISSLNESSNLKSTNSSVDRNIQSTKENISSSNNGSINNSLNGTDSKKEKLGGSSVGNASPNGTPGKRENLSSKSTGNIPSNGVQHKKELNKIESQINSKENLK